MVDWFNNIMAGGTVVLLVGCVGVFCVLAFISGSRALVLERLLATQATRFGFVIALSATVASLLYSDYFGYEPCVLCWYQRVFIYPQVVLYGVALIRKESSLFPYVLALSVGGLIVALYNTYLQYGGSPLLNCGVGSISCAIRYVYIWGFVTIPLMSSVTLTSLALIPWLALRQQRRTSASTSSFRS